MDDHAAFYEIRVKDHLDSRWSQWFDGLTVTNVDGALGEAVLSGPLADQAALHGVLARIRDLNLTLISVRRVDEQDR
jgi:hypothetical protein